jgi:hypothetical protein
MTKKKQDEKYHYTPWNDTKIWKTKAEFFKYIRGTLRMGWKRYPLKIEYRNSMVIPNFEGSGVTNPRVKKVGKCEICQNWFPQSALETDHIKPCGTIRDWETAGTFLHNMFCDKDNLRLLCCECHGQITYAERMGMSMEDAIIEKQCVAFGKLPAAEQSAKFIEIGLNPDEYSTKEKRRDAYREYLKAERDKNAPTETTNC